MPIFFWRCCCDQPDGYEVRAQTRVALSPEPERKNWYVRLCGGKGTGRNRTGKFEGPFCAAYVGVTASRGSKDRSLPGQVHPYRDSYRGAQAEGVYRFPSSFFDQQAKFQAAARVRAWTDIGGGEDERSGKTEEMVYVSADRRDGYIYIYGDRLHLQLNDGRTDTLK